VVELPDPEASSFESGNMLLMPLKGGDTQLLLSAAEQLSHAFFPSSRSWIHDGLASYAQVRLVEEKEGREAAIAYLQAHRGALLGREKRNLSGSEEADSLINDPDQFSVQSKAMYVWWMLADMVGENVLTRALENYRSAEDRDPAYVERLIESESHRELRQFFDDWVYHDRGLPDFRIASVYPSPVPTGGYLVTVTVENLGRAGAEVPVTLATETGQTSQRLWVAAKSNASVRIAIPSSPQQASVNDGSVPESDPTNNHYKFESSQTSNPSKAWNH
jgi:hypothetical protein